MKNKSNKPPYKPLPFRDGCNILNLYEEPFEDSVGNKAMITKVNFTDKGKKGKKGKLHEGYVLYVKWEK